MIVPPRNEWKKPCNGRFNPIVRMMNGSISMMILAIMNVGKSR